jgi:hypothetical protein
MVAVFFVSFLPVVISVILICLFAWIQDHKFRKALSECIEESGDGDPNGRCPGHAPFVRVIETITEARRTTIYATITTTIPVVTTTIPTTVYQTVAPHKTATSPATSTSLSFAKCTSESIKICRALVPLEPPWNMTRVFIIAIAIEVALGIYLVINWRRWGNLERFEEKASLLPAVNDKKRKPRDFDISWAETIWDH